MTTTILVGDVRERLKDIPDASVQCVCTSPPYYGLRAYLPDGHASKHHEIGSEPTLAGYIAAMVEVFREVRRVLRPDGVCFLNIGDSYASTAPGTRNGTGTGLQAKAEQIAFRPDYRKGPEKIKPKDLMMVPARLAIALQDDGWWLRSDIIWAKPNPMPESVTDRPTSAHEHIFLLTKSARYFYDADAVRQELSEATVQRDQSPRGRKQNGGGSWESMNGIAHTMALGDMGSNPNGANLRNVWEIATQPFSGAHFATFPLEIPRRCIKAGTSEKGCCSACGSPIRRMTATSYTNPGNRTTNGDRSLEQRHETAGFAVRLEKEVTTTGWEPTCTCDADVIPCTVLDPFLGSGTTLLVADQLGRNGIGIELNPTYAEMARDRIYGAAPMFAEVEIDAA